MQARSQSSRDMVQNAKLAEMQEEVRRRELRQQQGQQVQPLRPQVATNYHSWKVTSQPRNIVGTTNFLKLTDDESSKPTATAKVTGLPSSWASGPSATHSPQARWRNASEATVAKWWSWIPRFPSTTSSTNIHSSTLQDRSSCWLKVNLPQLLPHLRFSNLFKKHKKHF